MPDLKILWEKEISKFAKLFKFAFDLFENDRAFEPL